MYAALRQPHPKKYKYMSALTAMDDFLFKFDMGGFWRQSEIKAFLEKRRLYYVD